MSEIQEKTRMMMEKALLDDLIKRYPKANQEQLDVLLKAKKRQIDVGSVVTTIRDPGKLYTIKKITFNKTFQTVRIIPMETNLVPSPLANFRLATTEEIENS